VPKNPHTGLPLAKDPGVAILQLQNEDSLLFWTLNGVEGAPRRRLGERFGAWASQRYGSAAKAVAAWHGDRLPADDVPAGVLDVHNLWHLTTEGRGGDPVRLADGPGSSARRCGGSSRTRCASSARTSAARRS
jgi:hypothetical protein